MPLRIGAQWTHMMVALMGRKEIIWTPLKPKYLLQLTAFMFARLNE